MSNEEYKTGLATFIKNSEARHIDYKNMLETLYKAKKEFNTEDFDSLMKDIKESKNANEKDLKEYKLEMEYFNQGMNPPDMYKKKVKLHRYYLDTGLRETKERPYFSSDKDAWENLRPIIPNAYATLYRADLVEVKINNKEAYIESHNAKYTSQKIDSNQPNLYTVWVPVMQGITSHEYNVQGK